MFPVPSTSHSEHNSSKYSLSKTSPHRCFPYRPRHTRNTTRPNILCPRRLHIDVSRTVHVTLGTQLVQIFFVQDVSTSMFPVPSTSHSEHNSSKSSLSKTCPHRCFPYRPRHT